MKNVFTVILFSAAVLSLYPQPPSYTKGEAFSLGTNENFSSFIFIAGGQKFVVDEVITAEYQEAFGIASDPSAIYLNKYVFEYEGFKVKKTHYSLRNNKWEKEKDFFYEYNKRGLITLYSSFVYMEKTKRSQSENEYYFYDSAGRLTRKIYDRADSYLGSFRRSSYYNYNAAGDLVNVRREEANAGYMFVMEELYKTYDNNHKLIDSMYVWNRGNGETRTKFSFTRNDNGAPLTRTHTSFANRAENMIDSIIYTYDGKGRLKTEHIISWQAAHNLYEYSYNAAGMLENREAKSWDQRKSYSRYRYNYVYDAYGKLIKKIYEPWDENSSGWEPRRMMTYTYDNYGNCIKTTSLEYFEENWIKSRSNMEIDFPGIDYPFLGFYIKVSYKTYE